MTMRNASIPTLKGVFPEPKIQPKRDFLRENKIKVRGTQKDVKSTKKPSNGLPKTNVTKYLSRNSNVNVAAKKIPNTTIRAASVCSCSSRKTISSDGIDIVSQKSIGSVGSFSNKEIQTDDISDENFLYTHLKRCSSIDMPKSNREMAASARCNYNTDLKEENHGCYEVESNRGMTSNRSIQSLYDNNCVEALNNDVGNLAIDSLSVTNLNCKSGSSRRDLLDSKRSARSEVKLPKYLEREKREKEEELERERIQDPCCPEGHRLLNENERQEALSSAKLQFQHLINELNHMPMTSETLRTRTRKNEIEKSLVDLEADIRILSKSKVYTIAY